MILSSGENKSRSWPSMVNRIIAISCIGITLLLSSVLISQAQSGGTFADDTNSAADFGSIQGKPCRDFLPCDIELANACFGEAALVNPDPAIQVFHAVTRILVLMYDPEINTLLTDIGLEEEIRSFCYWTAQFPVDTNGEPVLPDVMPSTGTALQLLVDKMLPEINGALAALSGIDDAIPEPLIVLCEELQRPEEAYACENIEVDFGDVALYRAMLHFMKTLLLIIDAYNLNIEDTAEFIGKLKQDLVVINDYWCEGGPDQTGCLPDFLRLKTNGPAQLAQAKLSFASAIDNYLAASSFIRNETDNQSDDFISLPSDPVELANELADEQEFRDLLTDLQCALTGPCLVDNQTINNPFDLDLTRFFDYPIDIRDYFTGFTSDNQLYCAAFPDPTFNGILPGFDIDTLAGLMRLPVPVTGNEPDDVPVVSYGVLASDVSGGLAPATIQFNAFVADGAAPFTYDYDFGDGTTKAGAGKKETHTFLQPGTYTAQVTVTDAGGAVFVLQKEILVSDTASVQALTDALQTDADQMGAAADSGNITFLLNDAAEIIEKILDAVTNADDVFKTDTRESVRTKVETLVANTKGALQTLVDSGAFLSTASRNSTVTAADLNRISSGLGDVVSNMVKKGVPVTGTTLTDLTSLSGTIYTRTLDTLLQTENLTPARLAELKTNPAAAQAFFRNKPYLLDDIAGGTGIPVDSSRAFDPDQVDTRAARQQLTEQQTGLLYNALEPTLDIGLQISSSPGVVTNTIAEMVETLFNTYSGKTVTQTDVDEITRNVLVAFSDGTFLAFAVKSVNVVKDYMPRGLFDLPNGNRLGVTDAFALEFAAYPAFPHAVAAEFIKLGIAPSLSRAGGLELRLEQLLSLSIKPGWEYLKSNTFDSLTASFRVTGGTNPAGEAYSLLATYDTGYSQLLPPTITAMDELTHMLDQMAPGGFSIDTRSGVLTLGGLKLKPDYVFTGTSKIDYTAISKSGGFFHNNLAFEFTDANKDGVTDIVLHSESPMGQQVLYVVNE